MEVEEEIGTAEAVVVAVAVTDLQPKREGQETGTALIAMPTTLQPATSATSAVHQEVVEVEVEDLAAMAEVVEEAMIVGMIEGMTEDMAEIAM